MNIRSIVAALALTLAACGGQQEEGLNPDELGQIESLLTIPASPLPGKVEAENFKVGSQGQTWSDTTPTNLGGQYRPNSGVDIESTTDTGGGYNIGWIDPGEWLTYELNVSTAGTYDVSIRVASNLTGTKSLELLVDGVAFAAPAFTVANGWQSWSEVPAGSVSLSAGTHTLKVVATTGDFNLNSLTFALRPAPAATLTGSSVNGPLFTTLGREKVDVTRVYVQQLPAGSRWTQYADLNFAAQHTNKVIWLSFKEENPALVDAFLATKPADLGLDVIATWFHEPEDNVLTATDKANYRSTWQQMGPIIRKHGMTPALVLMRYTLTPASGRNWQDYYAPGSVDMIGWDSYRKGDAGDLDVSNQIDPILAVAATTGLPWGIGETGSTSERYTAADTAKWAAALRAYGTAHGAKVMCWWDQDTFKLDQPTASAWLD